MKSSTKTTEEVERAKLVEDIFTLMKPNAYAKYHNIWKRTRNALMNLSYVQLSDLYTLILCMEKRGGSNDESGKGKEVG